MGRCAAVRIVGGSLLLGVLTSVAFASNRSAEDYFTLPASALLEHADSFSAADTTSAICLMETWSSRFDADGRLTVESVRVFRVRTANAIPGLARLEEAWQPWNENRPVIRARVVTREGTDHPLDPANIIEQRGVTDSPLEYSDVRSLTAPLPNVGVGSIVVTSVKRSEHRAFFEQGRTIRFNVGLSVPVLETHVEVAAPASIPAQFRLHGLPQIRPSRRERNGVVSWKFSAPAQAPMRPGELWSVPDSSSLPRMDFSTGRSWKEIALAYRAMLPVESAPPVDVAEVRRALAGARDRSDSLTAIVLLLHKRVRYTAIRLGTSGLVPAACATTLARGYGDCKDKGVVLIAWLQALGIRSDLALLLTGVGPDVDPELPGMGMFDHAIVRVEGTPPVWIDATAEHSRPGELSPFVEGRRALLLTPGLEGLSRLPTTSSAANRLEESRIIHVAERGPARVVEEAIRTGDFESSMRDNLSSLDSTALLQAVRDYAVRKYGSDQVDSAYVTPTARFTEAHLIRFVVPKAPMVDTGVDDVSVSVDWRDFLEPVIDLVPTRGRDEAGASGTRKPRLSEFRAPVPLQHRLRIHVVVPDGFRARPWPAEQLTQAGPMAIRVRHRLKGDRVVMELELDTGPRIWTAGQYGRYVAVVDSLLQETGPAVVLEVVGSALASEGRHREALAEFRRLAQAHPREALHREQIADLMLELGLGESARAEARRGVELQPGLAASHREVGYISMHDLVGRLFGPGSDLPSARRALAKAVELDSNDVESRRWLALASLRNDQGALHGKGADIDLAISQMKRLRSQFEDQTLDGALLLALADRGRFDEILQLDPPAECEDPDARDMALVARSARDGVAASIAYMERSTRNARERRARLMGVALLCVRVGRVEDCQAFLQEIRRGGQLEVEEEKLLRLLDVLAKRYSPPTSSRTPEDAIRLLMYRSLTGDGKGMRAMLAPELLAARDTAELRELLKGMDLSARGLTQAIPGGEVTIANMFQVESEGDPKSGVRLRLTLPALGQSVGDQAYVTPGPQGFRLLAMSGTLDCIGLYALQLVERGMLAEARQWLDWAKEESGASAEASGPMELGWRWWMRSQNGDERHRLRSAAAGLAAQLAVPNEARKVLLEERERAGSEEERDAFDLAHAQCLLKLKRWSALEPLLATLSQRYPDSRGVHELRLESYLEQAKWTEARALIDARQSRHPDEFALMRERVSIEERSGNRAPGWDQSHRKLLAHGKATRQDFNLYAWALLVKGGPADSALAMARRACEPESQAGPAALHTLALANAHAGRLQDANRALQQQMRAAGTRSLGSPEWLVVGRIAESLGESAVARTAYGRVEELPGERGRPNSVWAVARSRLAGLGNP